MKLTLHIGYAKTATTYLQEFVFPSLDGIEYLGRMQPDTNDNPLSNWVYEFIRDPEYDLSQVAKMLPQDAEHVLISHEVLFRPDRPHQLIKRLGAFKDLLEEVNIVVSVRNQRDLIFSRYAHDIKLGLFPKYDLRDALDPQGESNCIWPICASTTNKVLRKSPLKTGSCNCNKYKMKRIHMSYYNYHQTYQWLVEEFGAERVQFTVSEQLRKNPDQEIAKLCTFLQATPPDGATLLEMKGKSSNARQSLPFYKELKAKYESNGLLDEIGAFYTDSNRAFANVTGIDLTDLGYY